MLRSLLVFALSTLLLALAPLSAQSDPGTTPDCIEGRARGSWDLPVKDQGGRVRGLLVDLAGHKLVLEARLTPASELGAVPGGRLVGVLTPLTSTGLALRPIAEVYGTYQVGPEGRGSFEAAIVGIEAPVGQRPLVVGKLGGAFADPTRDGGNTVGRFAGRWAICR